MTNPETGSVLLAPSPAGATYDLMYYVKGAASGGICCSITHGALCPVDVVKTRVQLDPIKVSLLLEAPRICRWINIGSFLLEYSSLIYLSGVLP